jgi:phospholipid/cholesterol/gamma-HCH transport system substrate-binding protein
MRPRKEFWVGSLVLLAVALMVVFGLLMGVIGPFSKDSKYKLLYGFAGGVEVGSPVRVSGVKVGKVESIEFLPSPMVSTGEHSGAPANLMVQISVSTKAAPSIRKDSRFYVNMAGIIGERYIEVSPGSMQSEALVSGSTVRGVDPPRIDQLLSQGYGVFGQIQDFIEENQETLGEFLTELNGFLKEANQLLKGKDRRKLLQLVDNLNDLTGDLKGLTHRLNDEKTKETIEQLSELIRRAHSIDKPVLKKFLQEEGIKARIF